MSDTHNNRVGEKLWVSLNSCPRCGSSNSIPVLYGGRWIDWKRLADEVVSQDKKTIAGVPVYYCQDCGLSWQRD